MIINDRVSTQPIVEPKVRPTTAEAGARGFQEALDAVRGTLEDADAKAADAMVGKGSLHTAMIAMTKADLGFRFLTQVRGKAVDAYRQLMNLQF
jgi:flagellar hook-basal body complex protein FliE